MYAGVDRISFFQSLLTVLNEAASKGYQSLHASCITAHEDTQQLYSEIPFLNNVSSLQSMQRDAYSMALLPQECKHLIPLFCRGDGNCLYR